MKANAPEKIYLSPSELAGIDYDDEWYDSPFGDSIEYIRTDAFIEKLESFLNKKDDRDFYTIGYIKRHLQEIIKEGGL